MTTYREKLKDPRWQKRRLEILERDMWSCQSCFATESTLHVHHRYYMDVEHPWDYPESALVTLCEECHELEGQQMPRAGRMLIDALKDAGMLAGDMQTLALSIRRIFAGRQLPQWHWDAISWFVASRVDEQPDWLEMIVESERRSTERHRAETGGTSDDAI
jgi:hypothetical protein